MEIKDYAQYMFHRLYKHYTWDNLPLNVQNREGFASVSRRSSEVQNNAVRSMKDINATETVLLFLNNYFHKQKKICKQKEYIL